MWTSRALAAAAVAATLVMSAGCVTRNTYNRDLAAEQARTEQAQLKTAVVQEKLDQANKDIKKAWDALAEESADYTANQKSADAARAQVAGLKKEIERLQNSAKETERTTKSATDKAEKASKEDADKLKKLQDQLDAAQKEIAELKAHIAEKNSGTAPAAATSPSDK